MLSKVQLKEEHAPILQELYLTVPSMLSNITANLACVFVFPKKLQLENLFYFSAVNTKKSLSHKNG